MTDTDILADIHALAARIGVPEHADALVRIAHRYLTHQIRSEKPRFRATAKSDRNAKVIKFPRRNDRTSVISPPQTK